MYSKVVKTPYFCCGFKGSILHTHIFQFMKYIVLLFCGGFLLLTSISRPLSSNKEATTIVSKKSVATVGEQVRSERVAHRMSKQELAGKLDISIKQLADIENNNDTRPTKEVLFKAQEVLGAEFVLDNY